MNPEKGTEIFPHQLWEVEKKILLSELPENKKFGRTILKQVSI
jgi:hypothetical protein